MADHLESEPNASPDEDLLEPTFNRSIKVRAKDHRLTSDAGVIILREADEKLGLISSMANRITDKRDQRKIRYSIGELIRERVFSYCLGYSAADDVDILAHDPAIRIGTWDNKGAKVIDERLASQPTQSRLIDALSKKENRTVLSEGLADWTSRHLKSTGHFGAFNLGTIDIDGFPLDVSGNQEGGEYNGYCKKRIYYPYAASFAPEGHYDSSIPGDGFVNAILRDGNASAHEDALEFIRESHRRCEGRAKTLDIRIDAGFTVREVLDGLQDDGIKYIGRLRGNSVLDRLAHPHVKRRPGRPPEGGYEYTVELGQHRAESWKHTARLVLCVVDKPDPMTGLLDLFPNYFFLITTWSTDEFDGPALLNHYRHRGTFEDRFGELNQSMRVRLSSPLFYENEAILLLSLLAYNLTNMLRREAEICSPTGIDLHRFQTVALKVGGRITTSGRRLILEIAKAALPVWIRLWKRISSWNLCGTGLPCFRPTQRPLVPPPSHAFLELQLQL